MDALIWILLPGFVAVGSGLLAFFIMQSRMEVAIATAEATLASQLETISALRNHLATREAGRMSDGQ